MTGLAVSFVVGLCIGAWAGWSAATSVATHRRLDWRDEPPSQRQLDFAEELGIDVPVGCSKGKLSDLIDLAKRSR